MLRTIATVAAVTLACASAAATPDQRVAAGEARLQTMLRGAVPGKPTSCLPLIDTSDSQKIEGVGILYGHGRQSYVMRFQDGCPELGPADAIVTSTPSGHLCRGDIAQIVEPTAAIPRGTCVVGDFTPYTRPPRK